MRPHPFLRSFSSPYHSSNRFSHSHYVDLCKSCGKRQPLNASLQGPSPTNLVGDGTAINRSEGEFRSLRRAIYLINLFYFKKVNKRFIFSFRKAEAGADMQTAVGAPNDSCKTHCLWQPFRKALMLFSRLCFSLRHPHLEYTPLTNARRRENRTKKARKGVIK